MSPLAFGLGSSRAFGIARSSALPYWLQTLNYYPSGSQSDGYFIADIAKDTSGNIYVLGNSRSSGSLSSHCLITKFNSIGEAQWTVKVPSDPSTIRHFGNNLHVTSDGATIYVVGETYNTAATGTSFDTLVVKITTSNISPPGQYGSNFSVETYRMYLTDPYQPQGQPNNVQENAIRSVVDSSGNIYIVYWYFSSGDSTFANTYLTKCSISSNTLNVVWSKRITASAGASNEIPSALQLDSSGNVYWVGNTGDTPIITKHNSTNGNLIWCKQITTTDYVLNAQSVHIDANDNIYVSGYSGRLATSNYGMMLAKLNTSGSLVWQRILQSSTFSSSEFFFGVAVTTDTSNNVYVVGAYDTGNQTIIFVKFNSTNGNDLFRRSLSFVDTSIYSSRRLIVDSNSLVFANVIGAEQRSTLLSKLPSDGSKTGTYTVQIDDIYYASSPPLNYSVTYDTFSAGTNSDVTSTTTVSDFSVTVTDTTQTTASISETGFNGSILELYKILI
jgi:hypothetical protein